MHKAKIEYSLIGAFTKEFVDDIEKVLEEHYPFKFNHEWTVRNFVMEIRETYGSPAIDIFDGDDYITVRFDKNYAIWYDHLFFKTEEDACLVKLRFM